MTTEAGKVLRFNVQFDRNGRLELKPSDDGALILYTDYEASERRVKELEAAQLTITPGVISIAQGRNSGKWVDLDRLNEPGVMRANILRGIIKMPPDFGELQPLLERIATLEQQVAELGEDAGRYRWLRERRSTEGGLWVAHGGQIQSLTCWNGKSLDAQVDHAKAAQEKGNG